MNISPLPENKTIYSIITINSFRDSKYLISFGHDTGYDLEPILKVKKNRVATII